MANLRDKFGKIGFKLIIPYLLASILTLCIVSGLIYFNYTHQLNAINSIQEEVSNSAKLEINRYLDSIIKVISLTGRHITLHDFKEMDSFDTIKSLLKAEPSILDVYLIDINGSLILSESRYSEESGTRNNQFINDKRFLEAKKGNQFYSEVLISKYNLPFFSYSIPLKDEQNNIKKILITNIDLSPMWDSIAKLKLKTNGYVYVVDTKGILITYKDIAKVKETLNLAKIQGVSDFLNRKQIISQYKSFTGEYVYGKWKKVDSTGWGIVAELPLFEVYSDLTPLFIIGGASLLFSLIFIVLILSIIVYNIISPLKSLKQGVLNLKEGDLSVKVASKTDDEIGDLANSFNIMVENLHNTTVSRDVLKESEEKYRFLIDMLPNAITIVQEGKFVFINKSGVRIFGFDSEDEIIGMEELELVAKAEKEKITHFTQMRLENKKNVPSHYETTLTAKGGREFPAEIFAKKITFENKPAIQALIIDISKRKQAEQEIYESEERYRAVSDLTSDFAYSCTITKDGQTTFHWVTQALTDITGFTQENLKKKGGWDSIIHPDDTKIPYKQLVDLTEGRPTSVIYRIVKKDGTIRWLKDRGKPISCDALTRETLVYGAVEDITTQKEAQDHIVKERRRAELYLDILGHDMSNIDQGIISYLEITLYNRSLDNKSKKFISKALQQARDMSKLSENVRKIAHIQDDKLTFTATDVKEALIMSIDKVKGMMPEKDIDIALNVSENDLLINGNEFLEDVFVNLISNAVKFNQEDNIKIEINARESDDKKSIKCEIKDHGHGISDEFKIKVFKRLQRGDESVHGTGLGLAIVDSVVSRFGGKVWIEDRVKGDHRQGANFIVLFPKLDD